MNLKECVIVSAARTPVGNFGGSLKDISAIELGAMVVKEAVRRAGIPTNLIDEVIVGRLFGHDYHGNSDYLFSRD